MDEVLVNFGGEIKSLENGHFGGYLVRFSSPESPDLAGDYFTKETDFGIKDGQTTPVYFHHRQPLKTRDDQQVIIKAKIGEATLSIDDEGVLIDAIIFNREKYEKAINKAGRARKSDGTPYLGWSSGTAPHLCDREKKGGANFIKFWQLGADASVTPTPCEPVNDVLSLKALTTIKFLPLDEIELLADEVVTNKTPVKAIDGNLLFNESLRQTEQQIWELWSALQTGARKIAEGAAASIVTGVEVDIRAALTSLTGAFSPRFVDSAAAQIDEWLKSENRDEHFYLKSSFDEFLASAETLVSDAKLEDHSQRVVSAVEEFAQKATALCSGLNVWVKRVDDKQEFRTNDPLKAGRVISKDTKEKVSAVRSRVSELRGALKEMEEALSELEMMAEPKKMADPDVVRGLLAEFEYDRLRRTHAARR